jgi:hypothetical protein
MDPARFDRLTIRLAGKATRRRTLRSLAASAALLVTGRARSAPAQTGPFIGIPLGGSCTDATECAQVQACTVPGSVTCADNGLVAGGPLTCCLPDGGFCLDAAHCCAGLDCVGHAVEGCGAGRCQPSPWASRSAACDAYVATRLAQLPTSSAYTILGSWGQSTPDLLGLPVYCPWPALPPESPWCSPEACVEDIPLEHADDGLGYCYWYDPELAGDPEDQLDSPRRRAKWRCGSLELIASTP